MTWTSLRRGNLKRDMEFLLIECHKNSVKAKIYNMQKNSECRLCKDGDKTVKSNKRVGRKGNPLAIVREIKT